MVCVLVNTIVIMVEELDELLMSIESILATGLEMDIENNEKEIQL